MKINPVLRATGVIGVTAAMVTGVTFAAFNSQATLTDNSVESGTVGLEVGLTADNTGSSKQGFKITKLIPGTGVDQDFYLKNTGDAPLDVSVNVPQLPGAPEGGYGFNGFENLTVEIEGDCDEPAVATTMAALNAGQVELPCNPLAAGSEATPAVAHKYTAHIDIKPEAVSGNKAGVGNFNLVFTGNAATTTPTPESNL